MSSLALSVSLLPTRSTTYSGNLLIDALLQPDTLAAPAAINYYFPDNSLLSSAIESSTFGPLWDLDFSQQQEFILAMNEWSAVAAVQPRQVSSIAQATLAVFGISQGNSSVTSIGGSPVTMMFTRDAGPFQTGGFERGTILHEIGHAYGLKHPFEGSDQLSGEENGFRYTVMAYDWWTDAQGRFVEPATPQLYDVQAIQYLYGLNSLHNSGDNVYQWGPSDIVFRCLWDGGGNDTIDASNQTQSVRINLSPGTFSEIGQAIFNSTFVEDPNGNATQTKTTTINGVTTETVVRGNFVRSEHRDNLSIAFGAVIENAIGTSFSDNLLGNTAANRLVGNAGNDTLDGGAGNDTMIGGAGNDTFIIEAGGDLAVENSSEGFDTIQSSIDWTLGANIENLTLTGTAAINGSGNSLANVLAGNNNANVFNGLSGNDTIIGGAGTDTLIGDAGADLLTGGADSDTFRFTSFSNSLLSSCDWIKDLSIGSDIIDGPNTVNAENLVERGAAKSLKVSNIRSVLTSASFLANGAATFRVGSNTYLALNDGVAGFQANTDSIINITGYSGLLTALAVG